MENIPMILPLITTILLSSIPPYPQYTGYEIPIEWEYKGENIEYKVEVSHFEDYHDISINTKFQTTTNRVLRFSEDRLHCIRVGYREMGSSNSLEYMYLGCMNFTLNMNTPDTQEDITEDIEQPESQKEVILEKEDTNIIPKDIDHREIIETKVLDTPEILGVQDIKYVCNISLLNKKGTYTLKDFNCNTDIHIQNGKYSEYKGIYTFNIDGTYVSQFPKTSISVYTCEKFNIFKPKTWFRCNPILQQTYIKDIRLEYVAYINIPSIKILNWGYQDSSFYIKGITPNRIDSLNINITGYISFQLDTWVDTQYSENIPISLTEETKDSNKPFTYPLDRLIGVTQWHGCTAYQCPHKGIDFGARLNSVVSVGDGSVVETGYDKYGGECNQGGWYVKIKHTNGMYSTYFHLDSFNVHKGDTVNKGQKIGISGNSGKWNCQSLGYHLHFDTRLQSSSSTHVNPVDYINIDWNLIPTIGKDTYPGRLTGDNPHPNF